jgi:ABC-type iron transport system FetAB permease component
MNEKIKTVSVTKFVLAALVAVLILNYILRIVFKLEGVPVTLGIAGGVAVLVASWFTNSTSRAPTQQERTRFLWLYSGILAFLFFALVFLASPPIQQGFLSF